MPNVLVTDAQMRSSLAVIRSLGKKGINVTAAEETLFATSFFSKYCKHRVVYPSPVKHQKEFISYMLELVEKTHYEVLIPMVDVCSMPIVEHEKEFSEYTIIALPDRQTFIKAYNKANTLRIAMKNGIPCPKTYFIDARCELEDIANELDYPVIIKPQVGFGSRGFRLCKNKEELVAKYKEVYAEHSSLLIQEYIPNGGEIGVYTLFDHDSNPCALSVQERLRSYPVGGGPSTLRRTIKNVEVAEMAFKLLKIIGWFGVAMVEFRVDPRDGIPKLMEVNPRFWGSLQLSILSGVDFPYLLYKLVTDGEVESNLDYKEGVVCRWMLPGDILWFLSAPNKIGNLREFCRFRTNYDIISLKDLGPTFGFMLATARYLFDKGMWKFVLRR